MRVVHPKVKQLLEYYRKISLLGKTKGVLKWDLEVNLPPKGSEIRAQQTALLTELITEAYLKPQLRQLLSELKKEEKKGKLTPHETAIVRNFARAARFYLKVPKKLIVEEAELTAKAYVVWEKAKKEDNFASFLPYLKRIVRLKQLIAQHLGYQDNPYDALLDLFEPELTARECEKIFTPLQAKLKAILKKIKESKLYQKRLDIVGSDRVVYPQQDQKQLALFVLKKMGYDFEAGRMDESAHPFTIELSATDVRITNRYKANDFRASFTAAMHEGGHALYEQGINPEYELTPLEGGVSYAIHESQSRFWENQVGRHPLFLEFLTPIFQAFYPEQLVKVGAPTIIFAFNQVKPGLIRVFADEVTYNLHIILRFELENDLVNGKIKATQLPEVWRAKMKEYLGVVPKTDREGVLQDVHWSLGYFGYFPTYTLGNLYAAQITTALKKDLPFERLIAKGELTTILAWLREKIHQHGSLFWPKQLIKQVCGRSLSWQPFVAYLKQKFGQIYQIKWND